MATNFQPAFPRTGIIGQATVATGNANYDGTGTLTTVVTGNADGVRVDALSIRPLGTNVASVLRVWLHNGTNAFLLTEQSLAISTATQTASLTGYVLFFNGLGLPQIVLPTASWSLRVTVGTTGAAGWAVTATGGSYTA